MNESALWLWRDTGKARRQSPEAMARRRRARLADIVAYARARSPYYRELYRHLPDRVDDPTLLPVTSKKVLMPRFDDWVTDREVTIAEVRAFVSDPELVGKRFLGRYLVATTSGTTGTRGIFLMDDWAIKVSLVFNGRMRLSWLGAGGIAKVLARGGRMAVVAATGGHFMAAAGATRLGPVSRMTRIFSVHMPLPELVAELNRFRPAILIGYGSVIALLAAEQAAGRLHINPVLVEAAGETLSQGERDRIATAFHTKLPDAYGGTECTFAAYSCAHGWYHVNTDWVVAEPVDADYRPTPPGEPSHTVLLSNLANRIQPILRYDLGDSILARPDSCPCGNPQPAIRIRGRAADVLTFPTDSGRPVVIPPLVFGTLADRTPGIELFQIVQTTPTNLRVRLRTAAGADPDTVWQAVRNEFTHLLTTHELSHVTLERAEEPPQQSSGGKYRAIIPLVAVTPPLAGSPSSASPA